MSGEFDARSATFAFRRPVGTSLAVGVAALGLAGGLLAGSAFAGEVSRTGGQDRIETALEIYRQNRSVFTSDTVVLAQSNGFADALTATPLAAALKAPILTTGPGGLDPRVLAVLKEQGVKNVATVDGPNRRRRLRGRLRLRPLRRRASRLGRRLPSRSRRRMRSCGATSPAI